ncbi:MAG: fatty acid desaturase [Planctomycetes bacterium]|nr:fatty acid desaturase [Planctomycetota bacterium]MBL7007611.1 fatty acid desaturase [Planctomycetota bacterium]
MNKKRIDWVNTTFIASTHLIAVFAVVYLAAIHFSWWTLGLGLLWGPLCGVSITGGYHRLFSHRTYRATWIVRAFYLFFGAGAFQNSVLKWSVDHRIHHRHVDGDKDPYNIEKGFWWAHVGWILFRAEDQVDLSQAKDLWNDRLVRFQHRFYLPIAVTSGFILPGLIGMLWGDPLGAVLVAGFLRLALIWNATFSINSVAHVLGSRPYSLANSARDSIVTALISLGEGYHNFHHRFQSDYRNGIRWYHYDPTKWWLWTLSKVRLVKDLKRVPREAIEAARQAVRAQKSAGSPA